MWPGKPPPLLPVPPAAAAASTASTSPLPPEAASSVEAAAAAVAAATKLAYKHQRYNQQLLQRWISDSGKRSRNIPHDVRWSLLSTLSWFVSCFAVTLHPGCCDDQTNQTSHPTGHPAPFRWTPFPSRSPPPPLSGRSISHGSLVIHNDGPKRSCF